MLDSTTPRFPHLLALWTKEVLDASAGTWLAKHESWKHDKEFAEGFAEGVPIDGAGPADYLQRVVRVDGVSTLAGIRFRGGNALEPFVDLVAWAEPLEPAAVVTAVAVVREQWAVFSPKFVRVLWHGKIGVEGEQLDQSIHAARAADVARGPVDDSVALEPWPDPEAAAALVDDIYRGMGEAFCEQVHPATAEGLRDCLDEGVLCRITIDGDTAGVWATEPGHVDWLPGQIVTEECLLPKFRGRGLAKTVQRLGAARLTEDDVLLGTIADMNHASRRTAEGAGRPEVLRYTMLPI